MGMFPLRQKRIAVFLAEWELNSVVANTITLLTERGGFEVDLFLFLVAMAVRALPARVLGHSPIREGDLLGVQVGRHHPHLARVVAEDVRGLVKMADSADRLDKVTEHGAAEGYSGLGQALRRLRIGLAQTGLEMLDRPYAQAGPLGQRCLG